jgi:predicted RNA-binding Zn-ribbon protein involved in translation (DUF1610 family)
VIEVAQADKALVTHERVMQRVKPFNQNLRYGYKNYSALFRCPECGHEVWQSLNYLGQNSLICENGKKKIIRQ